MANENRSRYRLPPVTENENGEIRRVGFELEISGITLPEAVAAVKQALDAETSAETAADTSLQVESLGEFKVELDWAFLKRKAKEQGEDPESQEWLETLSRAAALLVPVEVVCPPIPMTELDRLEPMVAALREAGAVGTEESLIAAYGVHINTEIPALDATTLDAYLKSFALLQWWLVDRHDVDPARKLSPYIDLYPEAYLRRVLARKDTTMDQIFEDYLEHNATRNRALDMLPMLSEIDANRIRAAVDDPRIQARPAFHYRLPNCNIEKPDWSLAGVWEPWLMVEKLAQDTALLAELSQAFSEARRPVLGVKRDDWVEFIDQWLKDRGLA